LENHIQVLKGSSLIRSAKIKTHHSPLVHNDINSTPQITTCEVLEGDTDTIDNEDEFCNEIKNHGDVIHTSDDT